ncbi:MAG: DUF1801 domain-containing protein [Chitinophagaceae bacterium]|nr:DUF1801 domain-containing protein [Chitinophagaceae bacterium]
MKPIDVFFLEKEEPVKSCLLFLRAFIPKQHNRITEEWKYGLPFYCLNGKMLCYLWIHKKFKQPYIGIVQGDKLHHPDLLQEKRARMKILLINPSKNIPVTKIKLILKEAIALYK